LIIGKGLTFFIILPVGKLTQYGPSLCLVE
ncbi:unnamed protein product, partial [marine sediment metagenome]